MNTKRALFWILSVLWVPCLDCAALDFRIFTNKEGVEIKAALVAVRAGKVTLKKDDGKTYALPVDSLSAEDKDYVKRWMEENVHVSLDFQFEKEKLDTTKSGQAESSGWLYNVTVTNRGFNDLADVSFKYAIFKDLNDRYAKDRNVVAGAMVGAVPGQDLARTKSLSFQTSSMAIEKESSKTASGANSYTLRKWSESLCGITVEVYVKGKLVERKDFGKVVPVRIDPKVDGEDKSGEAPENDSSE